ncbi:BCS1 and AAA domain-containing protein [Aspergillus aculeatinus CBS 121060]|uniref:P-loop containing nucleoside triphosphate hydrolase protein n=1 Tax=Aspergillus aculeatinus CBS 121060 TaxID=1448322 RepID=A0ACD1HFU8_9EURO|nr:P-loop containing nucleoside triphosphate hydrolase protein [Aspergillus aculeatinus CBS 121060]RAH72531.1 P-loop containing nucleoside triphosphate hydrolase protein [Aspergillus aculeatinus CBS 121060]
MSGLLKKIQTHLVKSNPEGYEKVLQALLPNYGSLLSIVTKHFGLNPPTYLPYVTFAVILSCVAQRISRYIWKALLHLFTTTVEISPSDWGYDYYLFWMARHKSLNKASAFVIQTAGRYDDITCIPDEDSQDQDICEHDDWRKTIALIRTRRMRYNPCAGSYYYLYQGRLVKIQRIAARDRRYEDILRVTTFGGNASFHKQMSYEAQKAYKDHVSQFTLILESMMQDGKSWWAWCMKRTPRAISSVILDAGVKQAFLEDVQEYLDPKTQPWYNSRGIPYRRGYLLHGPPGTGKSSLCFAIAGHLGLDLYLLHLSQKELTDNQLARLFRSLPFRCIVLIEDVDCVTVAQERADDGSGGAGGKDASTTTGVTLSGLLNAIDGVSAGEGRILIMTTNHVEKLDAALRRHGRVDMTIAYGYAQTPEVASLFKSIYASTDMDTPSFAPSVTPDSPSLDALASEFATLVPSGEFSGAEIQGYLLAHKKSPQFAIQGVPEWLEKTEEVRKGRRPGKDETTTEKKEEEEAGAAPAKCTELSAAFADAESESDGIFSDCSEIAAPS